MKKVLILLDGLVARAVIERLVEMDTSHSSYDIVYMNEKILPQHKPQNFTFYQFDPTSISKLRLLANKVTYHQILLIMATKDDTLAVLNNIRTMHKNVHITIYNQWKIRFEDNNIQVYNAINVLSNGLVETLPDMPVLAQNIGLRQGEIMEIRIPFGSSYAYRYIGSVAQKDWKIFALYRNGIMVNVKPTVILKPNDIILVIGKPEVLLQVFSAISKSYGHFPMPFGKSIYLFIDLYIQSAKDAINSVKRAKYFHERFNNHELIIKITRPSTMETILKIRQIVNKLENITIEYDYHDMGIEKIVRDDVKRYEIGIFILTPNLLANKIMKEQLLKYNKPILKVGTRCFTEVKDITMVLNDTKDYEQISPVVFDIASQLLYNLYVINADPIGDTDRTDLIEHLENLTKIYNQKIKVDENGKNPIRLLEKKQNTLQILPLKAEMFTKRKYGFFSTNSDLLSYDISEINQILIPIIE
jgi:hypothetical protein